MEETMLFSLFGLPVTPYALCVAGSALAGLLLLARRSRKAGCKPEAALWFAALALPMGVLGARLFYCLARLSLYLEIGLENALYLWQGGYMLWGAVAGCGLAAFCAGKISGEKAVTITDAAAAPGALVVALCRFAEYFSGEGIGMYVENEAFWHFPLAVCNEYEEWYWAVFMLEGLAALIVMALVWKRQRQGDQTKLFLLLYSVCQVLLESLRRDNFPRWLFVRVSQLLAVLVIAGLMLPGTLRWRRKGQRPFSGRKLFLCWLGFLLCVGVIIAMEFAVDKSANLPIWLCYLVEGLCCVGILGVSYPVVMMKQ